MVCEFESCIYNKKYACILENIHVNDFGMCDSCMMVSFDHELLEKTKRQQLDDLERRWPKLTP